MLSYREKLYQNYNTNQVNQSAPQSYEQKFKDETEWFSKEILPLIKDKKEIRILDIGCGSGSLLHACKLAGHTKLLGIDISSEQVTLAHKLGIKEVIHAETVEFLNSNPDQYDVIFCMDIIEHFTKDDVVVVLFHDSGSRYVGKMFNDDWMRDRNFLEVTKPKAINLVANHKNQKLLTVDVSATVNEALNLLNKYNISQIPVMEGKEYVGSLNDNYLFNRLIENNDIKHQSVKSLMQPAFPVVGEKTSIVITMDDAFLFEFLGIDIHRYHTF